MQVRLTPAVKAILIACFAMFVIQQTWDQFFGGNVTGWLGLVPYSVVVNLRIWQIFTYSFLHGDVMHLFLNMMMLVFIGSELEMIWGTRKFLKFYFFCATSAALVYLGLQILGAREESLHMPMIGASGAIYGLLVAYGLAFGERVLLFMMLFPMKAKHFVLILAGVEFMTGLFSGRNGLAAIAHLAGMGAGFCYLWFGAAWIVYRRSRGEQSALKQRAKARSGGSHLKLVVGKGKPGSKGSQGGLTMTSITSPRLGID